MISERTLKQWRKDSLRQNEAQYPEPTHTRKQTIEINNRILRLTQELMDQYLIRNIK